MTTLLNTHLLAKVAEEAGIGYVKCYDPFHLVAILEAKAAERGWYMKLTGTSRQRPIYFTSAEGNEIGWHTLTPTDPTDTANAKILCLAEVFGVEA